MSLYIDPPLPYDFVIEPQYACNLSCKMCSRNAYKFDKEKPWDYHTLIKVIESLPWARVMQIGGNHEPLMYKYFKEGIRYIYSKNQQSPFTTNGTLLKGDIVTLPRSGENIFVSIDGANNRSYRDIRNCDIKPVLDNLVNMRNKRPDVRLSINHILFKDRILEARELAEFCYNSGMHITFIYPIVFSQYIDEQYSPFRSRNFISDMVSLYEYCKDKGVSFTIPPITIRERPCVIPFNSPVIAVTGDVYPCCYIYISRFKKDLTWYMYYLGEKYEVKQEQYIMGNIFKQDFIDIWRGDRWRMLRNKLIDIDRQVSGLGTDYEKKLDVMCSLYNPDTPYDFCKICLYRWGRMGNI